MSDEKKPEVPGIDNLTPFEYALAGVTIPEGHEDSPSLAVIRDMRQMASEVDDAPATHAGLREFLQTGGSIAKRSDRRSARTTKPAQPKTATPPARKASPGSFIDITPIELVQESEGVPTEDTPADQVATQAVVNDFEDTVPPVPADELQALGLAAAGHSAPTETPDKPDAPEALIVDEPTGPMAIPVAPEVQAVDEPTLAMAIPAEPEAEDHSINPEHLGLQLQSPELLGVEPAPQDPEPQDPEPQEPAAADMAAGALGADDRVTAEADQPAAAGETGQQPSADSADDAQSFTLTRIEPPKQTASPLHLDDGTELPPRSAAAGAAPDNEYSSGLFPDVEDDPNLKVAGVRPDRDEGQDAAALAAASPLFSDTGAGGDADDGGTAQMPATDDGMAGILEPNKNQDEHEHEVEEEALTPAYAGAVPIQKRRLGSGALWALGGTMVVSAALAVGALWWAGGLGEGTETEAAAPDATTTVPADEAESEANPDAENEVEGSPSTLDMSQSGTTLDGADGADADASVNPDATDPSATTGSDEDETSASTDDQSTDTTEATATPEATDSTETTTPPGAEPPETTAPPAPEPEQTTSEAPSTEVTTSAGTGALAYIGDSVNVGSYSGPPVEGALVGLFEDPDRDGEPDARIDTRFTGSDGRYAFNIPAACYVIRFYPTDGYTVDEDLEFQAVCLEPGEAAPRIDGILYPTVQDVAFSAPPSGCYVEPASFGSVAGVEIYENDRNWADSYTFYDISGGVVARTSELGPPNDIDGPTDWEWEADESGFRLRAVWRVAAVRNGSESEQITCSR